LRSDQPLIELVGTPLTSSVKSGEFPFDHSCLPERSDVVTTPPSVFHVRAMRPFASDATPSSALARADPTRALDADALPGASSSRQHTARRRLMTP
jgi:hypothetical protein